MHSTPESLVERIASFTPRESMPLNPLVTGSLAELGTWVTARVDTPVTVARIDTDAMEVTGFRAGSDSANAAIDSGATIIFLTASSNTCSHLARAIIGLLTRKDAFSVYFQEHGVTDQQAMESLQVIRQHISTLIPQRGEPMQVAASSPACEYTVGLLLTASARMTPVITGTTEHLAAALIAQRLSMKATSWWRHGSTSPDPAVAGAVDRLGIPAGLPLDLADNSGVGAIISSELLVQFIAP